MHEQGLLQVRLDSSQQSPALTQFRWPVIIGIVIGSLILLSIIWCIARCLFCGASCCGSCLRCCDCCPSGSRRAQDHPSRFRDEYTHVPPTPYSGYQPVPAPTPHSGFQPVPAPMAYQQANTPQWATFDTSSNKKIDEDSLPPMPSWDTAQTRRVEDLSEPGHQPNGDLEMGRLSSQPQRMTRGGYSQVPSGLPVSLSSPTLRHNVPAENFNGVGTTHPYNSDLGAQRLGHGSGYDGSGYDGSQPSPLSPAPTYHTNPLSVAADHNTDRFAAGAASPSPAEYNRTHFQSSYEPSVSTRYEATEYPPSTAHMPYPTTSPPVGERGASFGYQPPAALQQRPPSFLQIGRKAVRGSMREI